MNVLPAKFIVSCFSIPDKGTRAHLTDEQKSSNREKSRTRVQIGLLNLTYNIKCVALLIRQICWNFDSVIAPVTI